MRTSNIIRLLQGRSFVRYVLIVGVLCFGTFNFLLHTALTIWFHAARHPGGGLASSASAVLTEMFGRGLILTELAHSFTLGFVLGVYNWLIIYTARFYFGRASMIDEPTQPNREVVNPNDH